MLRFLQNNFSKNVDNTSKLLKFCMDAVYDFSLGDMKTDKLLKINNFGGERKIEAGRFSKYHAILNHETDPRIEEWSNN